VGGWVRVVEAGPQAGVLYRKLILWNFLLLIANGDLQLSQPPPPPPPPPPLDGPAHGGVNVTQRRISAARGHGRRRAESSETGARPDARSRGLHNSAAATATASSKGGHVDGPLEMYVIDS